MIRFSKLKILINLEIKKLLKTNRGKFLTSALALLISSFFIEIYTIMLTLSFYGKYRDLVPISFSFVAFLAIFIISIRNFLTNLFNEKEYNILFSLPFKELEIIMSKIFGIYINLSIYSFLFLGFPLIYYTYMESSLVFIFLDILIILSFPILPSALGFIFSVFKPKNQHIRYSKQIFSMLGILLVVLFYILIFLFKKFFYENLYKTIIKSTYLFKKIIFPINFFNNYVLNKNIFSFLIFVLISVVIGYIIFLIISKNYFKIKSSNKNYKKIKSSSMNYSKKNYKKALLIRELKNYFASPTYITNTIFIPLFLVAFTLFVLFLKDTTFIKLSGNNNITNVIKDNLVIILCSINAFAQVTYCSISIEGKYNYILRSLPISTKDINSSKIKFGLSIILFPLLFGTIGLGIKYKYSILNIILMSICSISYAVFANLLGLLYDQKTYNFNWSSEVEIVKQRFSVIFLQISIVIPLMVSYIISQKLNINSSLFILTFINLLNILIWNKIKNVSTLQ